jgi:transposase-like protein
MSDRSMKTAKTRRRLAPSEKYEIFVQVLTGQATQREAADRYGVDRSNSAAHREDGEAGRPGRVGLAASVPGRAGQTAEQPRCAGAGGAGAVAGDGDRAGGGAAPAGGKPRWD